jgi:hypothetical protein
MAENSYQLPAKHHNALMIALSYAGVEDGEVAVMLLKEHASRCARIVKGNDSDLAILRVNLVSEILEQADGLSLYLHGSKIFWPELHKRVVGLAVPSIQEAHGQQAIHQFLDDFSELAERERSGAIDDVWHSKRRSDKAVRDMCIRVAKLWLSATSRPLPIPTKLLSSECWEATDAGIVNPLWVLLDSLSIDVASFAVRCLVQCGRGEDVESVKAKQ